MKIIRLALILFLAAGLGLAIFSLMVRRAVTMEDAAPSEARQRFEDIRAGFGSEEPLVSLDGEGRPVRSGEPAADGGGPAPRRLHVLVYRAEDERLARAEVPFWFFKLKGPVVQLALRKTDFDLGRLGVTPGELERLGPRLIFDETRENGDRVLVWTR